MLQKIKTITREIGVMSIGLTLAFVVFIGFSIAKGWTEPAVAPPGGNVGAPINTGSIGQTKTGRLQIKDNGLLVTGASSFLFVDGGAWLNTSGATNGLIVAKGAVGIGDTTPDAGLKMDVEGNVGATKYCDQNGQNCKAVTDMGGGGAQYVKGGAYGWCSDTAAGADGDSRERNCGSIFGTNAIAPAKCSSLAGVCDCEAGFTRHLTGISVHASTGGLGEPITNYFTCIKN